MIGGKVVLTYKRKRPHARTEFSDENELPNKLAYTTSDISATSNKHKGSPEDQKSENQKKDFEVCVEPAVGSIGSNILHSDSGYHPSHAQCIDSPEDVPEGKRLCSGGMKEDTFTSLDAKRFSRIKDEQLSEEFDTKELAFGSRSLLEKGPVENGCDNNPSGAVTEDSYAEVTLMEDPAGPCSCTNSSSELQHKCMEKCSLSPLAKTNFAVDSDLVDLKPSTETGCLEGADPPSIDEPHSSCVDAIIEKKFNSPLITFRRRSKRVKDVSGPERVSNLQGGDYSAVEASPSGTCSVNLSINDTCSVGNAAKCHSIPGGQDKKSSQNVDCIRAPVGSAPENNTAKEEERVLSPTHLVKDIPPLAEAIGTTEQPTLFTGEGSECPPNDGPNTTRVPDGIGSNGHSAAFSDLSIPPSDSRFVVDCNISLESDSDEHLIHNLSQECKNLNSSTEGIGEALSSDKERPTEEECVSVKAIGNKGTDPVKLSPTFTGMTSTNNYLQLFPEDKSNDMSPMGKSQLKAIDCKDSEERNGCLSESWSTPKPPSTRSPHFLGHSLPTEPMVEVYAHKSSLFPSPNFGFPSKEFIQENQRLSLLRHQMMLDNIVSRARAVEGSRFESPNLWLEEELDSLWVGVRRHGKGNWEAMLRDPRLQFLSWRTPWDLADRWQEEIRKLLNSVPVSDMNCFKTPELLLLDRLNGLFRSKTGKENPVDDFQLSLGEIYSQSIDGFQNRSMFKHDMNYQLQKPVSNTQAYPSSCPRKGRPMFNKAMLATKASLNANPTIRASLNGNIPHWLKEAVSIPPMPHDPSLLSLASSISSSTQCINQPCLDSNGAYETSRTEQQVAGSRCNFPQVTKNGKSESCQYRADKKQTLIIIDSDASSEETISDDLSVRPAVSK